MSYHLICLTFEWSYEHLITQISGMKKYIESRKDVELTVFNAVAKYLDQEVETSALEILHMPDLSKYDGVLIQGNRSWPQEERQRIVDEAQKKAGNIVDKACSDAEQEKKKIMQQAETAVRDMVVTAAARVAGEKEGTGRGQGRALRCQAGNGQGKAGPAEAPEASQPPQTGGNGGGGWRVGLRPPQDTRGRA